MEFARRLVGMNKPQTTVRGVVLAADRVLGRLVLAVAVLALAVAVSSAFYQVVVRFAFGSPAAWSEVLTRVMLIWMVYLGCMTAFRHGAMISIDLCYRLSRGRFRRLLAIVIGGLSFSFLALLVWFGAVLAWRLRFQNIAGLDMPISWAYAAIPVGAAFGILGLLAHLLDRPSADVEETQ